MKKALRAICWFAFVFWVFSFFYVQFMMHHGPSWEMTLGEFLSHNMNLVPFKTVFGYFHLLSKNAVNADIVVKNLLGNPVLFIPMGYLLPVLTKKLRSAGKLAISALVFNFVLEAAQVLLKLGQFDIDDIILRTFGALAGYAVFYLIAKLINTLHKPIESAIN